MQASGIVFESESEGLGRAESSKYHDKQRRAGGIHLKVIKLHIPGGGLACCTYNLMFFSITLFHS